MSLQKVIQRSEAAEAHGNGLSRWPQDGEHCRDEGEAAGKRNQHPATRNQTEFEETLVICRQEREKRYRRRGRGQSERPAYLAGGASEGLPQILIFVALGAVSDAKLNSEINSQSHE